jgi:hypothetical protein
MAASTFSIPQQQYSIIQTFTISQANKLAAGTETHSVRHNNDCQSFVFNTATAAGLTIAPPVGAGKSGKAAIPSPQII